MDKKTLSFDEIKNNVLSIGEKLGITKKRTPVFALDLGSRLIKLAEIEETSSGPELTKFASASLPLGTVIDGKIVEEQFVVDIIQDLMRDNGFDREQVCISAAGSAVIVKTIDIDEVKKSELEDAVYWEAEQYVPFKIEELNIDYEVIGQNPETNKLEILLVAAKKDFISNRRSILEKAGLEPKIVDVDTLALANIFWYNYDMREDPVLLVDIGASLTKINIVLKNKSIFVREVAIGGSTITKKIQNAMDIDFEEAEALKIEASSGGKTSSELEKCIEDGLEEIFIEISRCIDFHSTSTSKTSGISKIYVSGGTSSVYNLEEIVRDTVGPPIERLQPFERINFSDDFSEEYIDEITGFASLPLGLALRNIL